MVLLLLVGQFTKYYNIHNLSKYYNIDHISIQRFNCRFDLRKKV